MCGSLHPRGTLMTQGHKVWSLIQHVRGGGAHKRAAEGKLWRKSHGYIVGPVSAGRGCAQAPRSCIDTPVPCVASGSDVQLALWVSAPPLYQAPPPDGERKRHHDVVDAW
jgi:hypothetical protein